jgi:hypothetical protein
MVKTIEINELKSKLDNVLKDVKDNRATYIISINSIPVAKICYLNDHESELGIGISYDSTGLVNISEDY